MLCIKSGILLEKKEKERFELLTVSFSIWESQRRFFFYQISFSHTHTNKSNEHSYYNNSSIKSNSAKKKIKRNNQIHNNKNGKEKTNPSIHFITTWLL